MKAKYREITFTDDDVVEPDNWIPAGEYNPHRVRPWLLHDHGFPLAIVFASCLQDALDEAVDAGKLDSFQVTEEEMDDYDENSLTYLGNASEPFDIENIDAIELPNPKRSFVAQFVSEFGEGA